MNRSGLQGGNDGIHDTFIPTKESYLKMHPHRYKKLHVRWTGFNEEYVEIRGFSEPIRKDTTGGTA
jgi:hypothetical protein